jgi:protein-S-isoprenylcysteine O-methyltransferase Ste14
MYCPWGKRVEEVRPDTKMKYFTLAFLWTAWCMVHSLLISLPVIEAFKRRFGNAFRYYRIFYNGFSTITLIPVVLYGHAIRTEALFSWEGFLGALQILLVLVSAFLFVGGARAYDALQFFGIRQIRQPDSCAVLTEDCVLDTTGILGMTRHPWYFGGMIIIWARDLDMSAMVTNIIITGYFVVGTLLEERKLRTKLGEAYRDYQSKVSMFFPYKWLKARLG